MTFICTAVTSTPHTHTSVLDAKRHWWSHYHPAPVAPAPAPARPPGFGLDAMTLRQSEFIESLGGSLKFAEGFTKKQASTYIEQLLETQKKGSSMTSQPQPQVVADERIDMIKAMIGSVPDGYFALEVEGRNDQFIRISRPKSGKYKGSIKIQTQHSEALKDGAVLWPSGQMSFYRYKENLIVDLLELVVSHRDAMMRYAELVGNCGRCNKELTDDRSRHYKVGPICEPLVPWMIEYVDEKNDGLSYERLVKLGRI